MKTVIRNSYTPKLGDYCETIVVDRENERAFIFDQDGVFTEIPQPIDVEDILRQAAEYTDEKVAPINEKLETIEEGAQVNKIEHVLKNGTELTITNKTVNVTVPTKTSDLTNDGSDGTDTYVESAALSDYYTKTETDTQIGYETTAREIADAGLQEQIDAIVASSDVVDIVGTYAALQAYDTSKLHNNDIIKVLTDETRDDATTYYRWSTTTSTWSYIGAEGPFYTKAESDATFVPQTRTVNNKALSADITLTAQDVGALPDSTVIPTVNDATLTIQKNGTNVVTFTANSATNKTANIEVPTDTSDLTNGAGFITSAALPTKTSDLTNDGADGTDTYAETGDLPTKTSDLTNDGADGTSTYVEADELGAAAFSNDYTDLDNLPTIPTVNNATLTIQKNGTAIDTFTANASVDKTINVTVPTDTSDLTNNAGFITASVSNLTNYYPKTDTYSQQEVNSLISAITVPTKTSDLTNDGSDGTSTYVEASDLTGYQEKLIAGSNIQIAADGKTISATDTTYSDFTGATSGAAGVHGLVPAPASGETDKYLKSDGTWGTVAAPYSAGTGIDITNNVISADTTVLATQTDLSGKQDTLTAGDAIDITNNVISVAADSTLDVSSTNPVQNSVVTAALNSKQETLIYTLTTTTPGDYANGVLRDSNNNRVFGIGLYNDYWAGKRIIFKNGATVYNVIMAGDNDEGEKFFTIAGPGYPGGKIIELAITDYSSSNPDTVYDYSLQRALTAGSNVQINQNTGVISATDTKYTAGTGINITGGVISATGVATTFYVDAPISDGAQVTFYADSEFEETAEIIDIVNAAAEGTVVLYYPDSNNNISYKVVTASDDEDGDPQEPTITVIANGVVCTAAGDYASSDTVTFHSTKASTVFYTSRNLDSLSSGDTVPLYRDSSLIVSATMLSVYNAALAGGAYIVYQYKDGNTVTDEVVRTVVNPSWVTDDGTVYYLFDLLRPGGTPYQPDAVQVSGIASATSPTITQVTQYQAKLTAGSNITISGDTISATDTTYSDFTGATSQVAGTHGLVPAPTTSDTDKVLKGDGTWGEKSNKFVIMKYGESNAWAKFIAAYKDNAIVYCRASSNANPATGSQTRLAFMAYVSDEANPTNVEFQYVRSVGTKTSSQPVDQVFVYKLTNASGGTWSVQTRDMAPKLAAGTNTSVSYSSGTYTVSATDTTYSAFTGATSGAAGTSGLVPAPTTSDPDKFLKGDGTWATPTDTTYTAGTNVSISSGNVISATDTTYSAFTGATSSVAGSAGLVPAPATTDVDKFLKGDGTWEAVGGGATETTFYLSEDPFTHETAFDVIFKDDQFTTRADWDTDIHPALEAGPVILRYGYPIATNCVAVSYNDLGVVFDDTINGVGHFFYQDSPNPPTFYHEELKLVQNVFTGATSSVAGANGLVPAPAAGDEGKFLKGDGTWATAGSKEVTIVVSDLRPQEHFPDAFLELQMTDYQAAQQYNSNLNGNFYGNSGYFAFLNEDLDHYLTIGELGDYLRDGYKINVVNGLNMYGGGTALQNMTISGMVLNASDMYNEYVLMTINADQIGGSYMGLFKTYKAMSGGSNHNLYSGRIS